jgi:hypothetical protein
MSTPVNRARRRACAAIRKASTRAFKKEVQGECLITSLIPADDPALHWKPLISRAAAFFVSGITTRGQTCVNCKEPFIGEFQIGSYIFSFPSSAPTVIAVASFV